MFYKDIIPVNVVCRLNDVLQRYIYYLCWDYLRRDWYVDEIVCKMIDVVDIVCYDLSIAKKLFEWLLTMIWIFYEYD